jgi:hypothetical protein
MWYFSNSTRLSPESNCHLFNLSTALATAYLVPRFLQNVSCRGTNSCEWVSVAGSISNQEDNNTWGFPMDILVHTIRLGCSTGLMLVWIQT